MCISGTRTYIYWDRNGKFFGRIKDVGVWVRTPGGHIHPKTVAGLTYGVPTASHTKSTKSQYHRPALTGLLKTGLNNGIFEIWNIRKKSLSQCRHIAPTYTTMRALPAVVSLPSKPSFFSHYSTSGVNVAQHLAGKVSSDVRAIEQVAVCCESTNY